MVWMRSIEVCVVCFTSGPQHKDIQVDSTHLGALSGRRTYMLVGSQKIDGDGMPSEFFEPMYESHVLVFHVMKADSSGFMVKNRSTCSKTQRGNQPLVTKNLYHPAVNTSIALGNSASRTWFGCALCFFTSRVSCGRLIL